jgi:hypothetical protein
LGDQVQPNIPKEGMSSEGQFIMSFLASMQTALKADIRDLGTQVSSVQAETRTDIRGLWGEVNSIKRCVGDMREHLAEKYQPKSDCQTLRSECKKARSNNVTQKHHRSSLTVSIISLIVVGIATFLTIVNFVRV